MKLAVLALGGAGRVYQCVGHVIGGNVEHCVRTQVFVFFGTCRLTARELERSVILAAPLASCLLRILSPVAPSKYSDITEMWHIVFPALIRMHRRRREAVERLWSPPVVGVAH